MDSVPHTQNGEVSNTYPIHRKHTYEGTLTIEYYNKAMSPSAGEVEGRTYHGKVPRMNRPELGLRVLGEGRALQAEGKA